MAIATVIQLQPRPGRYDETLKLLIDGKAIVERLGGRVRVRNAVIGGEPNQIAFISEVDDWARFGELRAKLETDSELLALQAKQRADPVADITRTVVVQDLPLP
jgi:hypothetical protein